MFRKLLLGAVIAFGVNTAAHAANVTKYFTFTYQGDVTARGSFSYDDSLVGNIQGYNNLTDFSLRVVGQGNVANYNFATVTAWDNYRHFGYNTVSNSFFGGNTGGYQGCCASYLLSAYSPNLSDGGFGIRNGEIESYIAGVYSNNFYDNITITNNAVPEPATWIMLVAAFGLTGAVMRRRRLGRHMVVAA